MKPEIEKIIKSVKDDITQEEMLNIVSSGALGSLHIVQLVAALEENFNIEIDWNEVHPENFETIDAIEELIRKHKMRKG